MVKLGRKILTAVIIVVALIYGGILLYTKVINKPEDKLDTSDLEAVVEATTIPVSDTPNDSSSTAPVEAVAGISGQWMATDGSTVGYRVKEVLGGVDTEGVGRTNQVTGSLTISDTTVTDTMFEIEITTITSDSSRRDAQFKGNIMDAATYPTAKFQLTGPIELGTVPDNGQTVTATAAGDLTLHGVTQPVTFTVTAQIDNGIIGVLGSIDIVFADYGIANPSNGFVKTGDTGLLEFVLAFARA